MKRLSKCWLVLFAVMPILTIGVRAQSSVEQGLSQALPASSRLIHGLADLRFDAWSASGNYILAQVVPALHDRAGGPIAGTVNVIDVLQGSVPKQQWSYQWNDSDPIYNSLQELTSIYSDGGTVVCCVDTNDLGRYVLSPMYLIPNELTGYVRPAMQFLQANPLRKIVIQEPQKVNALLRSPNPFIAVAMFRHLVEADSNPDDTNVIITDVTLTDVILTDVILEAPPNLQTVSVYLLARSAKFKATKKREKEIASIISATKDRATLKAIDLALTMIFNKSLGHGPGKPRLSSKSIRSLRDQVKNREISIP